MLLAQFIYTECQAPGPFAAQPGFKIKSASDAAGSANVAELRPLLERAVQSVKSNYSPPTVDDMTSVAEFLALPRTLRLEELGDGSGVLFHLFTTGVSNGRPRNPFAHGLLFDTSAGSPGAADAVSLGLVARPADLWAGEGWLTPRGDVEKEQTTVGPIPRLSDRSPALDSRREELYRMAPGLRAAVFAAVERMYPSTGSSGPRILVVTDDPGVCAGWVSVVTRLMIPSVAWQFSFSTREDPVSPATQGGRYRIAGIAASDSDRLSQSTRERTTVVDARAQPPVTGTGWLLDGSTALAAGSWAQLAELVHLLGLENAVVDGLEALGRTVRGSSDARPLWGLGVAVLLLPEEQFTEVGELIGALAAETAIANWPVDLDVESTFLDTLTRALVRWIDRPDVAFERLARQADEWALSHSQIVANQFVDFAVSGYLRSRLERERSLAGSPAQPAGRSAPDDWWLPSNLRFSREQCELYLREVLAVRGLLEWADEAEPGSGRDALLFVARSIDALRLPVATGVSAPFIERVARHLGSLNSAQTDPGVDGWQPCSPWLWTTALEELLTEHSEARLARGPAHYPDSYFSAASQLWFRTALGSLETTLERLDPDDHPLIYDVLAGWELRTSRLGDAPYTRLAAFRGMVAHSAGTPAGGTNPAFAAEDQFCFPQDFFTQPNTGVSKQRARSALAIASRFARGQDLGWLTESILSRMVLTPDSHELLSFLSRPPAARSYAWLHRECGSFQQPAAGQGWSELWDTQVAQLVRATEALTAVSDQPGLVRVRDSYLDRLAWFLLIIPTESIALSTIPGTIPAAWRRIPLPLLAELLGRLAEVADRVVPQLPPGLWRDQLAAELVCRSALAKRTDSDPLAIWLPQEQAVPVTGRRVQHYRRVAELLRSGSASTPAQWVELMVKPIARNCATSGLQVAARSGITEIDEGSWIEQCARDARSVVGITDGLLGGLVDRFNRLRD